MRELAGREHDWTAYDSLSLVLVRTMSGNASAPLPIVARALRAAAARDDATLHRLRREAVSTPDPFAPYTVWSIAALAENPAAARLMGEAMLPAANAQGDRLTLLSALSGAELAAGRWRAAARVLAQARKDGERAGARYDAERLLWLTAACAALPTLPVTREDVAGIRQELARWMPGPPPPSEIPNPVAPLRPHLRLYLLGLLDARLGATEDAMRDAAALEALRPSGRDTNVADKIARTLRATIAAQRGQHAQVLRVLDGARAQLPTTLEALNFVDIQARWLRAEALRGLGRDDDAIRWYRAATQSIEYGGAPAMALMGPSLLHRAELLERHGDSTAARALFARFAELWADAELEGRALARSAAARAGGSHDTRARPLDPPREPVTE